MKIEVTQDDIDEGVQGSMSLCPIARALKRHFPEGSSIRVGGGRAFVDGVVYQLPHEARIFVKLFDIGWTSSPFAFELTKNPYFLAVIV